MKDTSRKDAGIHGTKWKDIGMNGVELENTGMGDAKMDVKKSREITEKGTEVPNLK